MTNCPECGAEIEPDALDEFDADIGDRLVCTVCTAALAVVKVAPVEVAVESDEVADDPDDDTVRPALLQRRGRGKTWVTRVTMTSGMPRTAGRLGKSLTGFRQLCKLTPAINL